MKYSSWFHLCGWSSLLFERVSWCQPPAAGEKYPFPVRIVHCQRKTSFSLLFHCKVSWFGLQILEVGREKSNILGIYKFCTLRTWSWTFSSAFPKNFHCSWRCHVFWITCIVNINHNNQVKQTLETLESQAGRSFPTCLVQLALLLQDSSNAIGFLLCLFFLFGP